MVGKMSIVFRIIDAILLTGVYLLQNVTLNLFLIRKWEGSILPYFWFLSDFIILLNFYLTLYLVGCHHHREKKANRRELVVLHQVRRPNNSTGGETSSSVDGEIAYCLLKLRFFWLKMQPKFCISQKQNSKFSQKSKFYEL